MILAAPVSVGVYLAAPSIIGLFGTEPNVAVAATTYLGITPATSVALFLSFVGGAGMGWVWTSLVPTSAPTSFLVWWILRQRIGKYERGRRELPVATAAVRH